MNADARIRTLGHDSLAVSQENLYSVEKSTVPDSSQNESQGLEMQGHTLEAVIPDPYHLPECQLATSVYDDRADCTCDRLRACEQRVLDAAINAAQDQHMYMPDQPLIVTGFNVAKSEILRAIRALEDTP